MESLTYVLEERALNFSDGLELQDDGLLRSRNLLKGWEAEPFLISGSGGDDSTGFIECGFHDMLRKAVLVNESFDNSRLDCGKSFTLKNFSTNDDKSAVSGLEIENVAAQTEPKNKQVSVESSLLSPPTSLVSTKRARVSNSPSLIPICQVLGCNKDLSLSKDYHKRHKVCEIHSKTAFVIVNGIRQRFCQQCSRFHIVSEFDEGKRSCRKRLAGHNQRRRKPQMDAHLGSALLGTDISRTSLFFSTIHPRSFYGGQCNDAITHSSLVKLEESSQIFRLTAPTSHSPFPNSILHLHGMGKNYLSENSPSGSLSHQELYAGSKSSVALSLLSVQSQKVPRTSSGISLAHVPRENHSQNSAKSSGKKIVANSFNLTRFDQEESPGGSGILQNRISQASNVFNPKCSLSPGGTNTLDLLQLSANLQRVEQEKYSSEAEVGIWHHPQLFEDYKTSKFLEKKFLFVWDKSVITWLERTQLGLLTPEGAKFPPEIYVD